MIVRAIFWIAIVAVLMPHEPDLGLGRPGAAATAMLPDGVAQWAQGAVAAPQTACSEHAESCAAALSFVDTLQAAAVQSLSRVKAEIEASQRQRAQRQLAYND